MEIPLKTRNKTTYYELAITLLGTYCEPTVTEKDTCIPVFIETLFTIVRTRKQPRCPLRDQLIKKLWYIYTVEYYSEGRDICISMTDSQCCMAEANKIL